MLDLVLGAFMMASPDVQPPEMNNIESEVEFLSVAPLPSKRLENPFPNVSAEHVYIFDIDSGITIHEKEADKPVPIASLTKLMTALVVFESLDMEEEVIVPRESRNEDVVVTKTFGLLVNDSFKVIDLMKGMLVASAGDTAVTLAHAVSGDSEDFINKMNDKARILNLQRTTFEDSFGLSVGNLSTAKEITWLFAHVWKKPVLREIMGMNEVSFCSVKGNCVHGFTTNRVLGSRNYDVLGGKTGTTDVAGECVVFAVKTPRGSTLIISVLGSEDRWSDVNDILDWIFKSYAI